MTWFNVPYSTVICQSWAESTLHIEIRQQASSMHTCTAFAIEMTSTVSTQSLAMLVQGGYLSSGLMHVRRQLIHVSKDGDPGVGHASPAGHLNHQRASGVLHDVACVDSQGGQAEEGAASPI